MTNSELIAEQLTAKLTPEQKLYAKKVEGSETKRSGEYCDGLASAILTGLQQEAARLNPQRFHKTIKAPAVCSMSSRSKILMHGNASSTLSRSTYKRPFEIYETDELFSNIQQHVPWKLT